MEKKKNCNSIDLSSFFKNNIRYDLETKLVKKYI